MAARVRVRRLIVAVLAAVGMASSAFAQQPGSPAPEPSEAPTPAPAPSPRPAAPAAPDATRPFPLGPAVPGATPEPVLVPPPTLPSTPRPIVSLPGGPGAAPTPLFTLRPSIELSGEYSDNFNLSSGGREDNLRSVAAPSITLGINGPFVRGTLGYTLSATHDTSTGDFNAFNSFLGVLAWTPTPRLTLTLTDTFTQSDEPSRADRLGLRRERREYTSNSLTLAAQYLLDRVTTTGSYRWSRFSSDATSDVSSQETNAHTITLGADVPIYTTNTASVGYEYLMSSTEGGSRGGFGLSDEGDSEVTGHRLTASFRRQLTSRATAGVTSSYAIRRVDQDDDTGSSNDYDSWTISLFSSYSTDRLSLSGSLGYTRALREGERDTGSVTTSTSLTYRFARAVARLTLESGFSETFAEGQDFGLVQTRGVTGSLFYPFTPSISGSASAYYRENEGAGVGNSTSDSTESWGGALALDVRLTRWLVMVFDYTYTDSSSGGGVGGYVENRARLALRASF